MNKNVCPQPVAKQHSEENDLTQRHMYHRLYILCMGTGVTCGFTNVAIHAEICLSMLIIMATHKKQ